MRPTALPCLLPGKRSTIPLVPPSQVVAAGSTVSDDMICPGRQRPRDEQHTDDEKSHLRHVAYSLARRNTAQHSTPTMHELTKLSLITAVISVIIACALRWYRRRWCADFVRPRKLISVNSDERPADGSGHEITTRDIQARLEVPPLALLDLPSAVFADAIGARLGRGEQLALALYADYWRDGVLAPRCAELKDAPALAARLLDACDGRLPLRFASGAPAAPAAGETEKYVLVAADGMEVEMVAMPAPSGEGEWSLCVSSQVAQHSIAWQQ